VPAGGPIGEAMVRIPSSNMPNSAFDDLENSENHLRSSWGVQGIASQQQKPDETARGMIMNQGRDTSRIGGGVSEIVEQSVARSVFNWLVQLYTVFYDDKHFAAVMGVGKAVQYVQLTAQEIDRQLIVGVSPNSMKPKDEMTRVNQAQELFKLGAIGPKVLLESVEFANPDESAADGALWQIDKMAYMKLNFPEVAQQLEQMMAQAQAQQAQQQAQMAQQQQQAQEQEQANTQATAQQGLAQKEQSHQQGLRHNEESHQQKIKQSQEAVSAKLPKLPQ